MSRLTVFLARFIGLFTVVLVVALLVRGNAAVEAAVANGPVMLVYAIISLATGVAMILGQQCLVGRRAAGGRYFGRMADPREKPHAFVGNARRFAADL
jgi:hypothetical protein